MLQNSCRPLFHWFQQNGETCHTAETTLDAFALFLKIALSVAELMSFGFFFKFYPSDERIWLCIRFNNAGKRACDRLTEDTDFGKKKYHPFRWSSFWSWRVCKQAKLSHLGHRKPARIYWKADATKTSHCLVRILVQSHNWANFLRKWERRPLQ